MNESSLDKINVKMGEVATRIDGGPLYTLLGSCIGLALFSRRRKVGGLAHIVLPKSRSPLTQPGKFADTAIPMLVEQMNEAAGESLRLVASLAGGASMFAVRASTNIGLENAAACRAALRSLNIPILDEHVGGESGRRMTFDTSTGDILIEIVGQKPIRIGHGNTGVQP